MWTWHDDVQNKAITAGPQRMRCCPRCSALTAQCLPQISAAPRTPPQSSGPPPRQLPRNNDVLCVNALSLQHGRTQMALDDGCRDNSSSAESDHRRINIPSQRGPRTCAVVHSAQLPRLNACAVQRLMDAISVLLRPGAVLGGQHCAAVGEARCCCCP